LKIPTLWFKIVCPALQQRKGLTDTSVGVNTTNIKVLTFHQLTSGIRSKAI
jgi:hypothetical protein